MFCKTARLRSLSVSLTPLLPAGLPESASGTRKSCILSVASSWNTILGAQLSTCYW